MFSFLEIPGYLIKPLTAGFLTGISCSLVGVFIVTTHLSFLGICIAHSAFTGALLGIWLNFNPTLGALIFSLIASAIVGPLADRGELSPDTSTGIVFSTMLGLAFLIIGLIPGSKSSAMNLFWGNILTVSYTDILLLAIVTIFLIGIFTFLYKEIQAVLCHRNIAIAVGIPSALIFYLMLIATGVSIAVSLQTVGGLLIYSLLLNPSASAYQLTYKFKTMILLSISFGVMSCWGGIWVSYKFNLPTGACIILTSSIIFILCSIFSPKKDKKFKDQNND
ncbi:MAG: metal ABC transporter permease [Candidatus Hydrogenedentes bacterium]|nr:metal ABC transporter permease [Candidatus Hydrogenedentota bacterium]